MNHAENTPSSPAYGVNSQARSLSSSVSPKETPGLSSWPLAVSSCLSRSLRVGICGASGSGKTALLREWMLSEDARNRRLMIYDPFGNLPGLRVDGARAALRSAARPHSATSLTDPDEYARLLPAVCALGACTLIVDEAQDVFPAQGCPLDRLRAIRQGRNRGVGLLWATQRPTTCKTDLAGNSQGMIIGTLLAPADMSIASAWGVSDPLPEHRFRVMLPGFRGDIQSRPY